MSILLYTQGMIKSALLYAIMAIACIPSSLSVGDTLAPELLSLPPSIEVVHSEKEIKCLQAVMWYEARGEGRNGMHAVATVVYHRLHDDRFAGETMCDVIFSKQHGVCQFSWTCKTSAIPSPRKPEDLYVWDLSRTIAIDVLNGNLYDGIGEANFFRSYKMPVKGPYTRVGSHIFYKR